MSKRMGDNMPEVVNPIEYAITGKVTTPEEIPVKTPTKEKIVQQPVKLKPTPVTEEPHARMTVYLPIALLERVKNCAWYERTTLASFAEVCFAEKLAQLEKSRGEPYPQREGEFSGGRPIK